MTFGASPSDGSSSSSSRGALMSARPTASICCSPPESVSAGWAARSASTGNSACTRLQQLAAARARSRAGSA